MAKINVADLDTKLRTENIDIDGIALNKDGTVRIDFRGDPDATVIQRAQAIVKAYDQDIVDAAKQAKMDKAAEIVEALPASTDIKAVKSIDDLADKVAKQGELLALIAEKLGLI